MPLDVKGPGRKSTIPAERRELERLLALASDLQASPRSKQNKPKPIRLKKAPQSAVSSAAKRPRG